MKNIDIPELPIEELFESGYQLNYNGYREWRQAQDLLMRVSELVEKNQLLSEKVDDLQKQLQKTYKRIKELTEPSQRDDAHFRYGAAHEWPKGL